MNYTKYLGQNVYTATVGYDQETDLMITFRYDGHTAELLSYSAVETQTNKPSQLDSFNYMQIAKGLDFLMQRIEDRGERFIEEKMTNSCYIVA